MRQNISVAVLAAALTVSPQGFAVTPGQGVLEDINLTTAADTGTIVVNFAIPINYVQHVPADRGTTLEIRVRPLTAGDFEAISPHRESLQVTPSEKIPLADVAYEADAGGEATLLLRFRRAVAFSVRPGDDFRSIRIDLVKSDPMAEVRGNPGIDRDALADGPLDPAATPEGTPTAGAQASGSPDLPNPEDISDASKRTNDDAARWMEDGRKALTAQDYPGAIGMFAKVLEFSDQTHHRDALELLGLARERNGQTARAKLEYDKYLERYPEGEGAERVRQRVAGLMTANSQPKEKLKVSHREAGKPEWEAYGGVSQYYVRGASITNQEGEIVHQSALFSDVDFSSRYRGSRYDLRTQFDARHLLDLDDDDSRLRVSNAFIDGSDRESGLSSRIGRQSRSSGGVLGRFDGGVVSYRFLPQWQISAVGGFPVETFVSGDIQTDRSFYGLSLDFGPFADRWAGNAFFIDQEVEGITDRRAVGGELRFQHPSHPVFALVDYDISFNALNIFQLVGNWFFSNGASVNLTADYRKVPFLSTNNALQGQAVDSIADLLERHTESEVRDLALDRTQTSRSVILGGTWPLRENLRLAADFTVANLSGTRPSEGIPAFDGTGYEYSYSAQLIASNLFKAGHVAVLGFRYSDKENLDLYSLNIDSRFPLTDNWRMDPRLRFDYITGQADGGWFRIRPSLRLNYRLRQNLTFEAEGGLDYSDEPQFFGEDDSKGYFLSVGYRWSF